MTLKSILIAGLVGALIATLFLHYRTKWLSSFDFELVTPPVPQTVLAQVRAAEERYYASRGLPRRLAEEAEDIAAFLSPALVYRANLSVGPYRIKAATIEELLPFAIEEGYLRGVSDEEGRALRAVAYFSEFPGLSTWGAAVVLEHLRQRHPQLRALDWATIAADPRLVAKLYSGYMGAGGAWEAWESDLEPGPEAKRRFGLTTEGAAS